MTIGDVLAIVMLFHRILCAMKDQSNFESNRFVVSQEEFIKFVDPESIPDHQNKHNSSHSHPHSQNGKEHTHSQTTHHHHERDHSDHSDLDDLSDDDQHEEIIWTRKAKIAANIFQSVLDSQHMFVTLGQVMQTVNSLIDEVLDMRCGDLTRIMNHLSNKMKDDDQRCQRKCAQLSYDVDNTLFEEIKEEDEDEQKSTVLIDASKQFKKRLNRKRARSKYEKNPKLNFQLKDRAKWNIFAQSISRAGMTCYDEFRPELGSVNEKVLSVDEVILDNTSFLVLRKGNHEEESKYNDGHEKLSKSYTRRKSNWHNPETYILRVFDTILSFNADVITLQQMFDFSVKFAYFLKQKSNINKLMRQYEKHQDKYQDEDTLKRKHPEYATKNWTDFNDFKEKYIDNKDFEAEILWLYDHSTSKLDLCNKLNLFWPGGQMVLLIHRFMQNTAEVTGIYTLRAEEFCLLKHTLQISETAARKLFLIIRHKKRSLSWKQLHNYFKFLLIMKYRIQFAINNSPKREDKVVSKDALQGELGISRHDEARWLFHKVEKYHEWLPNTNKQKGNAMTNPHGFDLIKKKLTWKQILEYLQKTLSVRDNIRDFFNDKKRDADYEENKAEKMAYLEKQQDIILNEVKDIKEHHGLDEDPMQDLHKILVQNAKYQRLMYNEFRKVVIDVYEIDIKLNKLKQLWDYLILEQNTEINMKLNAGQHDNDNYDDNNKETLDIEFLISTLKSKVTNYHNLMPKQILELAFVEFTMSAGSNDEDDLKRNESSYSSLNNQNGVGMDRILQEMQKMQRQWKQQNQALMQEIQVLKSKLNVDKLDENDRSYTDTDNNMFRANMTLIE